MKTKAPKNAAAKGRHAAAGGPAGASASRPATAATPPPSSAATNAAQLETLLAEARRLETAGDSRGALALLDRAVCLAPQHGPALARLGTLLDRLGETEAAVAILKRASEVITDDPALWETLSRAALRGRYVDAARWCLDRALALAPTAERWLQRGRISQDLQRFDEAVDDLQRALVASPDAATARAANELLAATLSLIGQPAAAAALIDTLLASQAEPELLQHRINLSNYLPPAPAEQRALRLAWNRLQSAALPAPPRHANLPQADRPLKIGYVSADFRQHAVAYFIEAILAGHHPSSYEVFCYAANHPDVVTARLQGLVPHWRTVDQLDDAALAELIRRDGIDVLVDLSGHTAGNRLGALARKPAPVQIGYLGYPGPTGLARLDYRITDPIADPAPVAGEGENEGEKLLRLPDCFHCYRPPLASPERRSSPFAERGYVTFGSFNNLAKIGPEVLDSWAQILKRTPPSRLHMKSFGLASVATRRRIVERFAAHGVAPERIVFVDYAADPGSHLTHYLEIDLALDSFPYNGTTTTCEALWMGTPVVSWLGLTHPGRVGASLLGAVGLPELVGRDLADYVDLAVDLAAAPARLRAYHQSLRARLKASPLCDEPRFVAALERAYRDVWTAWCQTAGL